MRKIVSVFVIILFFMIPDRCFPGFVPYHFVDAYYDYNASLSSGYYNSDIFLTIDSEPNPSSYYYWSKTVWFTDGNSAYMGLQTNGLISGQWVGKMAVFSVWNATNCEAGTKSSCEKFGNEGEGLSCRMKYDWQQGHKYRLRIWYVNDSWWAFFIKDMNTGSEDYLGKIKASSSSFIKSFCLFSEYFMPVNSCEEVPYAKVTFSDPTANNGDYTAKFSSQLLHQSCKNVKVVVSDNKLIAETGGTTPTPAPVPTPASTPSMPELILTPTPIIEKEESSSGGCFIAACDNRLSGKGIAVSLLLICSLLGYVISYFRDRYPYVKN